MTARRETAIVLVRDLAFAYVEGRKTQTRRLARLSDASGTYAEYGPDNWPTTADEAGDWHKDRCPYGAPGDRLRMLTGWATEARFDEVEPSKLPADARVWSWFDGPNKPVWAGRLRMARHLPKRLRQSMPLAELVAVHVERLNQISAADAVAEGVLDPTQWPTPLEELRSCEPLLRDYGRTAIPLFQKVWNSINAAKHPWASNPFVWVVEFKRREAGHG